MPPVGERMIGFLNSSSRDPYRLRGFRQGFHCGKQPWGWHNSPPLIHHLVGFHKAVQGRIARKCDGRHIVTAAQREIILINGGTAPSVSLLLGPALSLAREACRSPRELTRNPVVQPACSHP